MAILHFFWFCYVILITSVSLLYPQYISIRNSVISIYCLTSQLALSIINFVCLCYWILNILGRGVGLECSHAIMFRCCRYFLHFFVNWLICVSSPLFSSSGLDCCFSCWIWFMFSVVPNISHMIGFSSCSSALVIFLISFSSSMAILKKTKHLIVTDSVSILPWCLSVGLMAKSLSAGRFLVALSPACWPIWVSACSQIDRGCLSTYRNHGYLGFSRHSYWSPSARRCD